MPAHKFVMFETPYATNDKDSIHMRNQNNTTKIYPYTNIDNHLRMLKLVVGVITIRSMLQISGLSRSGIMS